jgi:hypothetical protein
VRIDVCDRFRWPSSSAAKKADADFKISFARRSSFTSRSSDHERNTLPLNSSCAALTRRSELQDEPSTCEAKGEDLLAGLCDAVSSCIARALSSEIACRTRIADQRAHDVGLFGCCLRPRCFVME